VSSELLAYALGFAVFALTAQTSHFERSRQPTIPVDLIHQLQKLREELPADAVVWSTWTYGYLITDVVGVATFDDGEAPDSVIDQLMSRAITSRNPKQLVEITSFIANHGRAGLQQALGKSADYPALLNLIGAAQRPVDRPVYLLFVEQMLNEFPSRLSKGRWDFVQLTGGAQDGYDIRTCRPIDKAREVLRCSAGGKADLSFDRVRGLVDGRPQLIRSLEIQGGSVRSEREFRADAPLVAQILDYPFGWAVVQFVSVDVFESVFNQMYVLGRFDRELFSEVYAHYPEARVFRMIAPESEPRRLGRSDPSSAAAGEGSVETWVRQLP
jgi:dolichyl-diphosphooligosaccharide--protein glycosyltransferase